MRSFLHPEGHLARALVAVWNVFLVSALSVCSAVPFAVFQAGLRTPLGHADVWIGALLLLPVGPAVHAAVLGAAAILDEHGSPAHPVRGWLRSYAASVRRLRAMWVGAAAVLVLVGYDLALFGSAGSATGDAVLLLALLAASALLVVVVATAGAGPEDAMASVAHAIVRPHVWLAWLLVAALAVAAALVPVAGPSLVLFTPGLAALVIVVVARAFSDAFAPGASRVGEAEAIAPLRS